MQVSFSDTNTSIHFYECIHVSSWEEECRSFDVATGVGHKRQAGWWKWLVCVNYSSGCQRASPWDTTHTIRVQVNIHVIAMKQLWGKIRSVITGLKTKWEFFISESTCYSTNRRKSINEDGQWTDGKVTIENFLFKISTDNRVFQIIIPNNIWEEALGNFEWSRYFNNDSTQIGG